VREVGVRSEDQDATEVVCAITTVFEAYQDHLLRFFAEHTDNPQTMVNALLAELLKTPVVTGAPGDIEAQLAGLAWWMLARHQGHETPNLVALLGEDNLLGVSLCEPSADTLTNLKRLEERLIGVPIESQAAVLMYKREGLPLDAIAKSLNISEAAVKACLTRAVIRFKHRLRHSGRNP
jgi:Sigma-70, region 4